MFLFIVCTPIYAANSYLSFCFIASFAIVLQRLWAKPIPLKMHVSLGSPLGRAPAVAGERVVVATIYPLRRLRRHLSQRERLSVSPIITKIGRKKQVLSLPKFCVRKFSVKDNREMKAALFFVAWEIARKSTHCSVCTGCVRAVGRMGLMVCALCQREASRSACAAR